MSTKLLSKELAGEVEEITRSQPVPVKKRSAKQKEREKKKLTKLLDKKAKQGKMKDILASLASHKDDIKEEQYAKMQSAKTLGKQITDHKSVKKEEEDTEDN